MFSSQWSLSISPPKNRRAEVLSCFQANHSSFYITYAKQRSRAATMFSASLYHSVSDASNEQQKSNDFIMFSGQRFLSIPITPTKEQWFYNFFRSVIPFYTHNNNRRVMILQCFQVNDPFLYPMQTAQERRFHNFFKPMIPFYIPWDNKWSEVLQ